MHLDFKDKFHFSIDDVFHSFMDLEFQKIKIHDHFILGRLFKNYETKGLVSSLYCFNQKKIGNRLLKLNNILNPNILQKEHKWIKFGYHAKNFDTAPYNMEVNHLKRDFNKFYKFLNYKKIFSQYLRFHYYSEMFELHQELSNKNIKGLFITDKSKMAYRIDKQGKKNIKDFGYCNYSKVLFIRTQFRIENFSKCNLDRKQIIELFETQLKKYGFIIVYVHEYDLYSKKTLYYLDLTLNILFNDLKISSFKK